jgi:hypothetical protein
MKLVFFSGDKQEVERVGQELMAAGIPCEVRDGVDSEHASHPLSGAELWVLKDSDSSRAFFLCVQAGVGFGKPKPKAVERRLWNETLPV